MKELRIEIHIGYKKNRVQTQNHCK